MPELVLGVATVTDLTFVPELVLGSIPAAGLVFVPVLILGLVAEGSALVFVSEPAFAVASRAAPALVFTEALAGAGPLSFFEILTVDDRSAVFRGVFSLAGPLSPSA